MIFFFSIGRFQSMVIYSNLYAILNKKDFSGLIKLKDSQIFMLVDFFKDFFSSPKSAIFVCFVSQSEIMSFLKTVDTINNFQRPVFPLGVPHSIHKVTNMRKFELNQSSKLRDNNEGKKHPCHTLCAFRCLISRPQVLNLRSQNQIHG